jgi:hypothetical protein
MPTHLHSSHLTRRSAGWLVPVAFFILFMAPGRLARAATLERRTLTLEERIHYTSAHK